MNSAAPVSKTGDTDWGKQPTFGPRYVRVAADPFGVLGWAAAFLLQIADPVVAQALMANFQPGRHLDAC